VVRELRDNLDSAAVPGTMIDEALLCRTDEDRLGIVIRTSLASVVAPNVVWRDIDRRGVETIYTGELGVSGQSPVSMMVNTPALSMDHLSECCLLV